MFISFYNNTSEYNLTIIYKNLEIFIKISIKIQISILIINLSIKGKANPKVIRLCARHRVQDILHV